MSTVTVLQCMFTSHIPALGFPGLGFPLRLFFIFIFIEKPQTFRHVNVHMIYSVHTYVSRRQHGNGLQRLIAKPVVFSLLATLKSKARTINTNCILLERTESQIAILTLTCIRTCVIRTNLKGQMKLHLSMHITQKRVSRDRGILLEKVADSARQAVKLAEPYKPYGGQFLEFCSFFYPHTKHA